MAAKKCATEGCNCVVLKHDLCQHCRPREPARKKSGPRTNNGAAKLRRQYAARGVPDSWIV